MTKALKNQIIGSALLFAAVVVAGPLLDRATSPTTKVASAASPEVALVDNSSPAPEPEAPTLTAEQKAQCIAEEVEADMCYDYLVALAEIEYDQMQQWRRGR